MPSELPRSPISSKLVTPNTARCRPLIPYRPVLYSATHPDQSNPSRAGPISPPPTPTLSPPFPSHPYPNTAPPQSTAADGHSADSQASTLRPTARQQPKPPYADGSDESLQQSDVWYVRCAGASRGAGQARDTGAEDRGAEELGTATSSADVAPDEVTRSKMDGIWMGLGLGRI